MRWSVKASVEPMLAVNLGTRGVAEAVNLIEYTNIPRSTALSDLRVANGTKDPYTIRMWCLGNEMDGLWQVGHKTAHEYGRLAAETAGRCGWSRPVWSSSSVAVPIGACRPSPSGRSRC